MLNFDTNQVVPEELLTSSSEYQFKRCYGKRNKKKKPFPQRDAFNNDFFNLYNASIRTDAINSSPGSSSSSSGDEAQLVPTRMSPTQSLNDSITFNFCHYDENRSCGDGLASSSVCQLDIGERVVIGCESDLRPKRKRGINRQRMKHNRNSAKERPLACSTMIESPTMEPSTLKRKLNRTDSGIGESTSSLQPEEATPPSGQSHESINDQTFVISKSNATQDWIRSDLACESGRDGEMINVKHVGSSVSDSRSLKGEEDEITFALRYFYNRNTGVPRTSTRAKLRLTPKRTERTRIADGHQTTVAHPACTFPFIKLLQKRKKSQKSKTDEKKGAEKMDKKSLSDRERNFIVKRMKLFKQSYQDNISNETIRTLANV